MALVTTIGSPSANSYATTLQVESYFSRRGYDTAEWENLETPAKELRLTLARAVLDGLRLRGVKATKSQALAFPRLVPGDCLMTEDDARGVFRTWEDLTLFAALIENAVIPVIPPEVICAQAEIAYQVIHSFLLDLDPFESGDVEVSSVGIGGKINVGLGVSQPGVGFLSKKDFDATSIIRLHLSKWLGAARGALV